MELSEKEEKENSDFAYQLLSKQHKTINEATRILIQQGINEVAAKRFIDSSVKRIKGYAKSGRIEGWINIAFALILLFLLIFVQPFILWLVSLFGIDETSRFYSLILIVIAPFILMMIVMQTVSLFGGGIESLYKGVSENIIQNDAKDFKRYNKAASNGDEGAMNNLGTMYAAGAGVKQNFTKAMNWYTKSAQNGCATAMKNIGDMYAEAMGVRQDYATALEWYRKAADNMNAEAMYNIGKMYSEELGVMYNYAEAQKWYTKAANNGYAPAMDIIGNDYRSGYKQRKDDKEATKWYERAAARGNRSAMSSLRYYSYQRGLIERFDALKWEYIMENGGEVGLQKWRKDKIESQNYIFKRDSEAALNGDATAMRSLGFDYEFGIGVVPDEAKAKEWYSKGALLGDKRSEDRLQYLKIDI